MSAAEDLREENERLRARVIELESALINQQRVVLKKDNVPAEAITRYWAKIDKSGGEAACWPRTTKSDRFHVTKRQAISFRRLGWLLAYGETWPTEIVLTCHNDLCLNPGHFAKTDADKFWSYVSKTGIDACWEWQGGLRQAYGAFAPRTDEIYPAHRYSYELAYGKIEGHIGHDPEHEICVLHRCDNPRCVRPDHLFLGSDKDNHDDMMAKGRHAHGPALSEAIRKANAARKNMEAACNKAMGVTPSVTGGEGT